MASPEGEMGDSGAETCFSEDHGRLEATGGDGGGETPESGNASKETPGEPWTGGSRGLSP